ncbi:MAG: hypothetical protein Q4G22_02385 [Paracoccus sp. (in: a-proteobacteria)]|uniref:hypothetical protein n=1 Tax=Paracoccus sp. TaxID=267 RepID=UPI0026DFEA1F|nr:hypothetical protein [Paracoccus sp. (in: a-proteobacteria)]MDO5630665.1 hypothetical protein [Paracoccus sp. (in: a-proteobacteria)]
MSIGEASGIVLLTQGLVDAVHAPGLPFHGYILGLLTQAEFAAPMNFGYDGFLPITLTAAEPALMCRHKAA